MSVFIGIATAVITNMEAYTSIVNIRRSNEDQIMLRHSSRGDISRQQLTEQFLQSKHDYILYLDGDMQFPPDTLERLLSHKKQAISGLYFRRQLNPCFPIAYENDPDFNWPMLPLIDFPDEGLIKVGATGWGCFLVHRSVFEAVKPLIGDAPFVMDGAMPEAWHGQKRIGADLRFCYYVRKAGIDIWMDCGLRCGHFLHIPIGFEHYRKQRADIALARYFFEVWKLRGGKMDKKNLELRLRGHEKQLEGIKLKIKKLLEQQKTIEQQIESLRRQGDNEAGAIQELREILAEVGDAKS